MDSLTHAILGASVAETLIGRKVGNKSVLLGAIIGTIPDFDVFIARFYNPVKSLLVHRGFTHSILFVLIFTLLLGILLNRIFKKSGLGLNRWILMVLLILGTHIFIDLFTTYGTGLFEPFSHFRVEWSTLAIIDPFLTVPLFIGLMCFMIFNRTSHVRRIINLTALIFGVLYLIFTIGNKFNIQQEFKNQLSEQNIEFTQLKTVPLPLSNFLWMGIATHSDGYFVGIYSMFDKPGKIAFYNVDRNEYLIAHLLKDKRIKELIRFTKGYYSVEIENGELILNDLRFGKFGFSKNAPYIFSFDISHNGDRLNIEEAAIPACIPVHFFRNYVHRIFGDAGPNNKAE